MSDTRDDHEGHDPTDPDPDAELDPGTDHVVRRLLADARNDAPMPDHVASRLDQTLAGLVAERDGHAEVTALTAVRGRRRRRLLIGLGAAAAFAVVAGVALPTMLDPDSADRGSVTSSDRDVTDLRRPAPVTLRAATAEEAVQAYVAGLDEPVETPAVSPLGTPLDEQLDSEGSSESEDPTTSDGSFRAEAAGPTCEQPGQGEVHPATYDGREALLVLTGLENDSVLARVLVCAGDSRKKSGSPVVGEFVVPQP